MRNIVRQGDNWVVEGTGNGVAALRSNYGADFIREHPEHFGLTLEEIGAVIAFRFPTIRDQATVSGAPFVDCRCGQVIEIDEDSQFASCEFCDRTYRIEVVETSTAPETDPS